LSYLTSRDIHRFRNDILLINGEDVSKCIQCGKCSAGCPISPEMDLQPNQVLRLIQTNDREPVLRSSTIWLCASCQTCSVRCPEGIDIARIMDSLRKLVLEERIPAGEEKVVKFNEVFLDSIRKRGRIHEFEMVMKYNLALRQPFKDAHLGPMMFFRGKLGLLGHKIKEAGKIKTIFKNSKRLFKELDSK
jgi:heterodisulfide reductase subunit C2